jgi:hypothetical protein
MSLKFPLFFFIGISLLVPAVSISGSLPDPPLLVELFTSQGCSSCPPAEGLLNGWGMELFHAGKVLPLSFHVDYWDYLGWKDPFSSPLFTERQGQYAGSLGSSSLYTPEMVVSGRVGFVGSDAGRARQEIESPDNPKASVRVALGASPQADGIALKIRLEPTAASKTKGPWKIMVAVFENHLMTHVERGENRGRDLEENFVVRELAEIKNVTLEKTEWMNASIPIQSDWQKPFTGIAVFLEDGSTLKIGGVNWVYPLYPKNNG